MRLRLYRRTVRPNASVTPLYDFPGLLCCGCMRLEVSGNSGAWQLRVYLIQSRRCRTTGRDPLLGLIGWGHRVLYPSGPSQEVRASLTSCLRLRCAVFHVRFGQTQVLSSCPALCDSRNQRKALLKLKARLGVTSFYLRLPPLLKVCD